MKLLIFTTVLSIFIAASAADQVRDADGNPVSAGTRYYIRPVSRDICGGVTLESRNGRCPLDVVVTQSATDAGQPVTFSPFDNAQTVNTGVDINIEFQAASTACPQAPVWRLAGPERRTETHHVTTGGIRGNPGQNTLHNWFKIEQVDSSRYRISFCPSVCNTCKPLCRTLGINRANRWLELSNTPFVVQFVKAPSE